MKTLFHYKGKSREINYNVAFSTFDLFGLVKKEFCLDLDIEQYVFFSNKEIGFIPERQMGEFAKTDVSIVHIIKRDHYAFQKNFIDTIYSSIKFAAGTLPDIVFDLFDRLRTIRLYAKEANKTYSDTTLKSIIPNAIREAAPTIQEIPKIIQWFSSQLLRWNNDTSCHSCQEETRRLYPDRPTKNEYESGAVRVDRYVCLKCYACTRKPININIDYILKNKEGGNPQFCIVFAAILRLLGYGFRFVSNLSLDYCWLEIWDPINCIYIHVDPCQDAINAPLLYECGWGKGITWVCAVGEYECVDVTTKYTSNILSVLELRQNSLDETIFQQMVGLRNGMWSHSDSPNPIIDIIIQRQIDDLSNSVSCKRTPSKTEKNGMIRL